MIVESGFAYIWLEKAKVVFLVMKCEEVAASSNSWKSCENEKKMRQSSCGSECVALK